MTPVEERIERLAQLLRDMQINPGKEALTDISNPGLLASMEALWLVIETLDSMQPFRGAGRGMGLTRPLWELMLALRDLREGVAPPMLKPPKVHKKGSSTPYQAVNAWAAIYLDCLLESGIPEPAALSKVVPLLRAVRVSRGDKRTVVKPTTVRTWRNDLSRNKGKEHAQAPWDRYKRERHQAPSVSPARWVEWAEEHLRQLTAGGFQISP